MKKASTLSKMPTAVDITDVSGSGGNYELTFKPNGGASASVSIHMKRRHADISDTSKYYTVTVINTTGHVKIYPTKQN